jgi:hypothetical protein
VSDHLVECGLKRRWVACDLRQYQPTLDRSQGRCCEPLVVYLRSVAVLRRQRRALALGAATLFGGVVVAFAVVLLAGILFAIFG